ncbi:MAG: divalent-cation tolerance protein CutA [Promethearchaeota archaeon]
MNKNSKHEPMIFLITIGNKKDAEELAYKLVESKLAACCNLIEGLTSIYYWNGKIEKDSELLIIAKTSKNKADELISFVKQNHPYDVPECIGLPIAKGNEDYLNWIFDSLNRE